MSSNYYFRPTEEEDRQIVTTTTTTTTLPSLPMFERSNIYHGLGANNGCYYYDNCVECDSSSGDKECADKHQNFTPLVPMLPPPYSNSLHQHQQSQLMNDVLTYVNRPYKVEMAEEIEKKEDSYSKLKMENCPSAPASSLTLEEEQAATSAVVAAPDSQAPEGDEKHKCLICSKTFKRKIWLEVHSCKHSGHETYKCPQCPKKFKFKSLLDLHAIKHCDVRNFPCTMCDKKFKTKYQLKQHANVSHSDLKRFECRYCQKKFKRKNQLMLHSSNSHPTLSPQQ